jgi:type IX secretion system PorP/SprF family membrane protein
MKTTIYTFVLLLFGVTTIQAQQYPLFSNYILNAYGFNPAALSTPAGMVEARATYRTQWVGIGEAPQTQIFNLNGRLKKIPLTIGGYFFKDVAGVLNRTGGMAMIAYNQPLGEGVDISVGFSGGYYGIRASETARSYSTTDPTLTTATLGAGVPDFNAGLMLNVKDFYLGISIPQILQQKINFSTDPAAGTGDLNSKLLRHYYGMLGYNIKASDNIRIEPSVMLKYIPNAPFQFDASARVIANNLFWIGASYRSKDAVVAMLGIEKGNFTLGYAYDITLSNLKAYSNGSHEVGLAMRFGAKADRDKDGIPDKDDQCPDEPGIKENKGCPKKDDVAKKTPKDSTAVADATTDTDKDGILDKDDDCPKLKGTKACNGCPICDTDRDGIADNVDKCPDIAGIPNNNGCPYNDRDNDGIRDDLDPCPDEVGPITNAGCPTGVFASNAGDLDKDGVRDEFDRCPATAGSLQNYGCPEVSKAELEILRIAIQGLYFDTNKSIIRESSFQHLNNLATLLKQRTQYKVRISGYTDARGDDKLNLDLSKRRAEAVRVYLTKHGVGTGQLITEYYGERKPAAHNTSANGLQLNRRVEMEFAFD